MNKVILTGRLTKDPELKFLPNSENSICTFTIAVNKKYAKAGQSKADFFRVKVWNKLGEAIATNKVKGDLINICGRLENNSYEAKDGTKRYFTEVIAEDIDYLSNKNKSSSDPEPEYGNDVTPIGDFETPF